MSQTQKMLAKYTSSPPTTEDSIIYDDGTNVGIGTASPANKLTISGNSAKLT